MIYNDKELKELGLVRTWDGKILDNRDGFYDDYPDPIAFYDTRTCMVVSHGLLEKLIACWMEHHP